MILPPIYYKSWVPAGNASSVYISVTFSFILRIIFDLLALVAVLRPCEDGNNGLEVVLVHILEDFQGCGNGTLQCKRVADLLLQAQPPILGCVYATHRIPLFRTVHIIL